MVLAVEIYQLWREGYMEQVAALAVVMVVGLGMLTLLGEARRIERIADYTNIF